MLVKYIWREIFHYISNSLWSTQWKYLPHRLIKGYTAHGSRLWKRAGFHTEEFLSRQTWVNTQQHFCFKCAHFLLISHSLCSHPRIIYTLLRDLSAQKNVMRKSYSTRMLLQMNTRNRRKYIRFWEMEVCVFAAAIYGSQ